jgi:hypothetical protein
LKPFLRENKFWTEEGIMVVSEEVKAAITKRGRLRIFLIGVSELLKN